MSALWAGRTGNDSVKSTEVSEKPSTLERYPFCPDTLGPCLEAHMEQLMSADSLCAAIVVLDSVHMVHGACCVISFMSRHFKDEWNQLLKFECLPVVDSRNFRWISGQMAASSADDDNSKKQQWL
ncbi:hypothetical protein P7K49_026772 [Saguinus oedipus]|uniref:Uncharacterized protein n=1 Tax=Saguinus oedipus TaxID=9490 RepID=A0ABQ9UEE9_SAGOE|nr:hypothetical protein P7K49_026772 [Saguinus oedipus]